jgi:magnesium transporter
MTDSSLPASMPASLPASTETAASSLMVNVPTVRADERAGDVVLALKHHKFSSATLLCFVDGERTLLGTVRSDALLAAEATATMLSIADTDPPRVLPDANQEQMAHLALRRKVSDIVVVTPERRFVGVVPALALMRVLYREHAEDMHKLAGIVREDRLAEGALTAPPRMRARDRLPWLLVGLVGSAIATWVTSRFEATLAAKVTVSFFIPGLVYLADAVGTQTEAIVIRGLAHEEHRLSARKLIGGELTTGLLIGALLAGLVFPAVWLAFSDLRLAIAVAFSLAVAAMAATTIGFLLPWLLHRRGIDPAFGSGPLATVLQDVLTLVVYLSVVRLLL